MIAVLLAVKVEPTWAKWSALIAGYKAHVKAEQADEPGPIQVPDDRRHAMRGPMLIGFPVALAPPWEFPGAATLGQSAPIHELGGHPAYSEAFHLASCRWRDFYTFAEKADPILPCLVARAAPRMWIAEVTDKELEDSL